MRLRKLSQFKTTAIVLVWWLAAAGAAAAAEEGMRWRDLSPAQQQVLKPLEREWPLIPANRKQKWLEIAARHPNLPPAEQQRVSSRMAEWANMSPTERGQARLNFQEARQLPAQERQARWEAYQSMSPAQRRELAASKPVPKVGATEATKDGTQAKSNLVPNPAFAAPPRPVAPTVVQARPGATTSLMSQRPAPPSHQQTGLPKIAASPGFVDKTTLLPQRGPQAAATRPAPKRESNDDKPPSDKKK